MVIRVKLLKIASLLKYLTYHLIQNTEPEDQWSIFVTKTLNQSYLQAVNQGFAEQY